MTQPPVLSQLVAALRVATSARLGRREANFGQLVEVVNDQWVISSDALFCLDRYFRVLLDELVDAPDAVRQRVLAQPWVDRKKFIEAFDTVVALQGRDRGPGRPGPAELAPV